MGVCGRHNAERFAVGVSQEGSFTVPESCAALSDCCGPHMCLHVWCVHVVMQAGWNLEPCKSCGVNVLTDTNFFDGLGLSVDQCYIPPGYGAAYASDSQQLVAYECNNGSYGVAERTFGVEPRPCKVCATIAGHHCGRPGWHLSLNACCLQHAHTACLCYRSCRGNGYAIPFVTA